MAVLIVAPVTILRGALIPMMGITAPYNVSLAALLVTAGFLVLLGSGLAVSVLGPIAG